MVDRRGTGIALADPGQVAPRRVAVRAAALRETPHPPNPAAEVFLSAADAQRTRSPLFRSI